MASKKQAAVVGIPLAVLLTVIGSMSLSLDFSSTTTTNISDDDTVSISDDDTTTNINEGDTNVNTEDSRVTAYLEIKDETCEAGGMPEDLQWLCDL